MSTEHRSDHEILRDADSKLSGLCDSLEQMNQMMSELLSQSRNPALPQFTFTPGLLSIPGLVSTSYSADHGLLSDIALTFTGPNTLKGPLEVKRRCNGATSLVFTERFGMAVSGGRRLITVTNSAKSICELIVTAEAPGGAPVANPAVEGEIDTLRLAPGATDILQVTLVEGEVILIQCPNSESVFKPPCEYAYRIDRVPAN